MCERVVGGVKNAIAGRSGWKKNTSWRELAKIAGDEQSAVAEMALMCSSDLLLSHIENIFPRYEILDPEVPIALIACSHLFQWCTGGNGLHPACRCCVDMISLI